MKIQLKFIFCYLAFFCIIIVFSIPLSFRPATNNNVGFVVISVYDNTNEPINNAKIVIAQTNESYATNKYGTTKKIALPANIKNNLKPSCTDTNWQEYTIIVYASGFLPHILHGLKIKPNETRVGVIVQLKPYSASVEESFSYSYDYPDLNWQSKLIRHYK